jgi:cytochrome c oxidase assembly factor CtaG
VISTSSSETASPRNFFRDVLGLVGIVLWITLVLPPVVTWSRQYEFVQATQFCLFALVIPCLLAISGPWRWLGLRSNEPFRTDDDGALVAPRRLRRLDRWARSAAQRGAHARVMALLIIFMVQAIVWRSSPAVDVLVRHPWVASLESVALVSAGTLLWLELVDSPPFSPSAPRPYRIGVSAVAMWTVWVLAYLMAMAQNSWYHGFAALRHPVLSVAADQQVTTGVMWFIAAGVFLPVVFSNLYRWLQSEEDPDEELSQLIRKSRSQGFFGTN